MDKKLKSILKSQIESQKTPHASDGKIMKWGKIINTDFSATITTFATRNSKNDVIWSLSRESAGDMLDAPEEKFTKGHMIWGGVSYRGLVPRTAPIFAGDLYNEYEPKPKTINSIMYADMI